MRFTRMALSWAACLALTLLSAGAPAGAGTTPVRAGKPARQAAASAPKYPPPRHHGTLRITGSPRDGGTVRAAGLSWRPGRLPARDRLLSFEVGYSWQACTAAGKCRAGADTTAAPFAARRYVAAHADTGRFLKVTVTATEVVEIGRASCRERV